MTSVQSLLPPSNGSKIVVLFLLIGLLTSCASGRSSSNSRPTVIKPKKEEAKTPEVAVDSETIDTINWTFIPDETSKPIESIEGIKSAVLSKVEKSVYKVAVLMPFRTNAAGLDLDANNIKFAQFYGGMKLAAAERDADVTIRVHTYSTNREGANMSSILDDLSRDLPDVIIGPYETDLLQQVAQFAKDNRITVISPWKSSTKITENNPYYLQLRPNITDYYESMVKHINNNFDRSKVCILTRPDNQDVTKARVIQKINLENSGLPITQPYHEYQVSVDTLLQADSMVFSTSFKEGIEAFIIPHYIARDEAYIYSCLRKLYGERGEHEFYVYTMPLALTSEQVDINILKNLNIRACEFKFVDSRNVNNNRLREGFYNKYGWIAEEDAYYGYDVMQFVKKGLATEGQYFHYYLQNKTLDFDQMVIKITPKLNEEGEIDYLVNSHMYIIEFDTDHFTATSIED